MMQHRQLAIIQEEDVKGLSPYNHLNAIRHAKALSSPTTPSPFNHMAVVRLRKKQSPGATPPSLAKDVSGDQRRRRRRRQRKRQRAPKQLFSAGDKENGGGGESRRRTLRSSGDGPKTKAEWTPGREARKTKGPLRPLGQPQQQPQQQALKPKTLAMDDASSSSPSSGDDGSSSAAPSPDAAAPVNTFVLEGNSRGVKPQWLAVKRDPRPTLALQYADAQGVVKILSIELTRLHEDTPDELCDAIFGQCSAYFVGIQRAQVLRLLQGLRMECAPAS